MATLTKKQQQQIKTYRMWAVMQAEDRLLLTRENERQADHGLHNQHVADLHRKNNQTCMNARMRYAEELGLDF